MSPDERQTLRVLALSLAFIAFGVVVLSAVANQPLLGVPSVTLFERGQ